MPAPPLTLLRTSLTFDRTVSVVVYCRALVQSLWGPEAGGHAGIGGGPREVRFGFGEADRAVVALRAALAKGAA